MKDFLNFLSTIILTFSVAFPVMIWVVYEHGDKIQLNYKMLVVWGILHVLTISYVVVEYLLPRYPRNK